MGELGESGHVELDLAELVVEVHGPKRSAGAVTGVVDQQFHPTLGVRQARRHQPSTGGRLQVRYQGFDLGETSRQLLEAVPSTGDGHHRHVRLGELANHGPPNTARGAGD